MHSLTDVFVTIAIGTIKLLVEAYGWVTWPLYYVFSKTLRYMPLPNNPVETDFTYNEEESRTLAMPIRENDPSSPWRAVESMDELAETALPGCYDLVSLWLRTVKFWPDVQAFGTRAVLNSGYKVSYFLLHVHLVYFVSTIRTVCCSGIVRIISLQNISGCPPTISFYELCSCAEAKVTAFKLQGRCISIMIHV